MKQRLPVKQAWEGGKKHTLNFYRLKSKWKFASFNKEFRILPYFDKMIGKKKKIKIADLGAGIISVIGNLHPTAEIELYPSDILADEFNRVLKRKQKRYGKSLKNPYGYKPLFPVEKQDMAKLTYKDEYFDIVHCVNGLDHCAEPFKAIKEMYRVCKKGGWIYLRHFPNNAKKQKYCGFHQWNITPVLGDCLFWSREDQFFLSDCVKGFKTEVRKELEIEPDNMVISTLHKR